MQIEAAQLEKIPKNSYIVVEHDSNNEDHIIKKRPTTGARIMADKFVNDVFSYTKKGMQGSRNSNFYEFLSLGLIPNVIGSTMLILMSNAIKYGGKDEMFANMNGKKMAGGVILYAAGKWLGNKIINKGVQAKTGIDLEMPYKKVIHELPETKGGEGKTSVEFHKVFESQDFPRWDLINKQGEEKNDRYEYYNKLAKRMGYKGDLNSADQVVQPKIREVLVKSSAAKSISSYVWAALGCAIAAQEPVGNFMNSQGGVSLGAKIKKLPSEITSTFGKSVKELSETKIGKGLMIGAAATSLLGIFNATRTFKADKENKKSCIDYTKEHMEF